MAEKRLSCPRTYWSFLIGIALAYHLIGLPFRIAFNWWHPLLLPVDLACDLIFIIDIACSSRVKVLCDEKKQNYGLRRLFYVNKYLYLEILALLPLDWLFAGSAPWIIASLRSLRLLRYVSYSHFQTVESRNRYNSSIARQILEVITGIALIAHLLGCAWFFVGTCELSDPGAWVHRLELMDSGTSTQYLKSIYWAIVTITTVGYGDIAPVTDIEILFCIIAMLIGASYWAYALATITAMISGRNKTANAFRESLGRVTNYLQYRQIPKELEHRVTDYYENIWRRHKTLDISSILSDLPTPLRNEISLILHRDIVKKVPFFQSMGPGFINSIVGMLKPQVFSPGDTIIHYGELGSEMYFVSSGEVKVYTQGGKLAHSYGPGDFFGELALLSEAPRTATLKSATFCDIFVLSKEDFDHVLKSYPEFALEMEYIAEERLYQASLAKSK